MTKRAPLILAIALLLLPVLYVGSYFAMLEYVLADGTHVYRLSSDVHANRRMSRFFWPLEQIDRRLRPERL